MKNIFHMLISFFKNLLQISKIVYEFCGWWVFYHLFVVIITKGSLLIESDISTGLHDIKVDWGHCRSRRHQQNLIILCIKVTLDCFNGQIVQVIISFGAMRGFNKAERSPLILIKLFFQNIKDWSRNLSQSWWIVTHIY